MLKDTFYTLLGKYTNDEVRIGKLWNEITTNYSAPARHYHTLAHLENLLLQLSKVKTEIQDWEAVLFALYYHDVVYNVLKNDNEEQSADLAAKVLKALSVDALVSDRCVKHLLATQKHVLSTDIDTNYFIDADLSVLGQPWEQYHAYAKNVRKEYAVYPDLVYNPGRKKVLQHFLEMDRIFKTHYFFDLYQVAAKENLRREKDAL